MRLPWVVLPWVLLGACEPASTPSRTPRVLSVTPLSQRSNESRVVTLQLDEDPPLRVDYGQSSARLPALPQLRLGDAVTVTLDSYLGHGQYLGRVGPVAYGTYDLHVLLPDGREAAFSDARYVVKRAISYSINPIGRRQAGVPFDVTVRVDVKDDLPFAGTAVLQLYKDGRPAGAPEVIGPLSEGESGPWPFPAQESGDDYVIRITDDQDNDATSQSFPVDPVDP